MPRTGDAPGRCPRRTRKPAERKQTRKPAAANGGEKRKYAGLPYIARNYVMDTDYNNKIFISPEYARNIWPEYAGPEPRQNELPGNAGA